LDSLVDPTETADEQPEPPNPLLRWAGMFNGGPGDTAHRAEEIFEAEIGKTGGFGDS
jgi:hypothetical protein